MKLFSNISVFHLPRRFGFLAVLLFICILPSLSFGQTTKIKGRVTDADTGEPLPYANVFFKGTTTGVSTDDDGYYTLETRNTDLELLRVEYVSYIAQEKVIKKGAFNQVNFALKMEQNILNQIVVKPDYRYIRWILSNIEHAKKVNNPEERDRYQCRLYTKMELDLVNADTQIKNKLLRKNFGFVFDYMDTSVVSGQPYLPGDSAGFPENYSRLFWQREYKVYWRVPVSCRIRG